MDEIWKPIPGHPDYEVSDQGRVRSLDRVVKAGYGTRRIKGRMMALTHSGGYRTVTVDGKACMAHTLVLEAFIGPRPKGMDACHGPAGAKNDSLSNLYWGTQSARIRRSMEEGTWYTPRRRRQIANLISKGFGAYERRSK